MRLFAIFFFFAFGSSISNSCYGQCNGLDRIRTRINIHLGNTILQETVSKAALEKNDLEIRIENATYKILAFSICYDCHSGLSYDLNCKEFSNSLIKQGNNFLTGTRKGDLLTFDCIILNKDNKKFTTDAVLLQVID